MASNKKLNMISVTEAKVIIAQQIKNFIPKSLPLKDAAGLTLAEDVFAATDIPNFIQSSVDGYAIKFSDSKIALSIAGESAAGNGLETSLGVGEAVRIFTGAPLPRGADTVVMQEKVLNENGYLQINDELLKEGDNVRPKGSEINAGSLAMQKGTPLSAAAIGFLAGIGSSSVSVYTPPSVTLIITGKELQQPGKELKFGQVFESNSLMLSAALRSAGIRQIEIDYADDELDIVKNGLDKALLRSDIVLLAGGISVGDYDFVLQATQLCAVQKHFHKVKQRPGKPLFFGTKSDKIVFGLPGNPSSALTCFYEYVLPSIEKMMQKASAVSLLKAVLKKDYNKAKGLTHFLKGSYFNGEVTLLGAQESYRLASYANANCLIVFDEDREVFKAGEQITIHLLPF